MTAYYFIPRKYKTRVKSSKIVETPGSLKMALFKPKSLAQIEP